MGNATRSCRNAFQKAAHRPGQPRVGAAELEDLLRAANSDDPESRLTAAQFLCPCHLRRRVAEAWAALHRLMEDSDVRVRRAAWHTLEDGGDADTPETRAIATRVRATERDSTVLGYVNRICERSLRRQRVEDQVAVLGNRRRGKCDFCGEPDASVVEHYDTPIPDGNGTRAALACERCAR